MDNVLINITENIDDVTVNITESNDDIVIQIVEASDGIDGKTIESASFVGDDIVFVNNDESTVVLTDAKIELKGGKGDDGYTPIKGVDYFDGIDGDDGREIELQKSATHIQWRYVGETLWTDLVLLSDLKGAKGDDGLTPVKGIDYFDGEDGANGKSVEIQNSGTYIQWRLVGDITWINIVALSALKGDAGYTPIKGVDYFDGEPGYTPVKGVDYFDGAKGDDGAKITTAVFSGNDILFTLDDASTVSLVDAKTTLKGDQGDPATDTNTRIITFVLHRGENATTGTNKTNKIIIDKAYTIVKAYAYAVTAPTGADLVFDINVNGSTIWSTQSNRLKIVAGANSGNATTFNTTTLSEDDILSIDIDQIGSSVPGADITVILKADI